MNARLALARVWFPAFIKKRKLLELVRAAADAFSIPTPDSRGQSIGEILHGFSVMAEEQARSAVREDRAEEVSARLFRNARLLGEEARRAFRPRNLLDIMETARLLYAVIGIDFRGDKEGSIVIRSCAFSRNFTPEACRLLSSMDAGILSGLAGEGRLEFFARLTEGAETCRARFSRMEKTP